MTDPALPHDKTRNFSGNRIPFVPMHSVTLWATRYLANGFGIGVGGRHTSDVYTQEANRVVMQGYTVANAALYYKMDKGEFQVNIDNVFDKRDYFVSSIRTYQLYPGEPRTVSTRYSMKF